MTKHQQRIEVLENEIKIRQNKVKELKYEEDTYTSTLTEICPVCKGGKEENYVDEAGDIDTRNCTVCKGYGKIGPIECSCGRIIGVDMLEVRKQKWPVCPWCGRALGI